MERLSVVNETSLTHYSGDMVYTFEHLGVPRMPWNECKPMDEKLRFVARLLEGEIETAKQSRARCAGSSGFPG